MRVIEHTHMRVGSGPFTGMHYIGESFGSVLVPKLLGIYERELHARIEEIIQRGASRVVDIGAAEGYYAVGLALRMPRSTIWAFEADPDARVLMSKLATQNQVNERIHILGSCDERELSIALGDGENTVIVCDVEGFESVLLNPETNPALKRAAILVEVHPKQCPGVSTLLTERFESTHSIERVHQQPRTRADFPYQAFPINLFPSVYLELAVSEYRQPWEDNMVWFWMVPRHELE